MPENESVVHLLECPDEDTLQRLTLGNLPEVDRAQLEDHVDHCDDCRRLWAAVGRTSIALAQTLPVERSRPIEGTRIGRHIIVQQLGEGSTGTVVAAHDPDLDRRIALKILRCTEGGEVGRLMREAKAVARVVHPNVVAIHDVGTHHGQVYFAMELVDGETLASWLTVRHPWRDIVERFIQAGKGLAAAHAVGLVHRDFKPANVLVGRDGVVRVVDFGLASTSGSSVAIAPGSPVAPLETISATGTIVGTPAYMAPEQLRGGAVDSRSDQFSFCVALFEALYGSRPFSGRTLEELTRSVQSGVIAKPGSRTAVPRGLRRIVGRGLAVDPDRRFLSMTAVVAALEQILRARRRIVAGLGVVALAAIVAFLWFRGATPVAMCQGASRRLAAIWDAPRKLAIEHAILASGFPLANDTWNRIEPVIDRWSAGWVTMHTDACEATRVRGEQSDELLDLRMQCLDDRRGDLAALTNALAHADATLVSRAVERAEALPELAGCANAVVLRARVAEPRDAATRARLAGLRARTVRSEELETSGKIAPALELANTIVDDGRALGYGPFVAQALYQRAIIENQVPDVAAAERDLIAARLEAEASRTDDVAADAMIQLVDLVTNDPQRRGEADRVVDQATAAVRRLGHGTEHQAALWTVVGALLRQEARWDEAVDAYQHAIALFRARHGGESLNLGRAYRELAILWSEMGRQQDALSTGVEAMAIVERRLGKDHPELRLDLSNLAGIYMRLERLPEALDAIQHALRITESFAGPDSEEVARVLVNLGTVLFELDRVDEAMAVEQRALAIEERVRGPDHPELAAILASLGNAAGAAEHYEQASRYFTRCLAILEAHLGRTHPDLGYPLIGIGQGLMRTGQPTAAIAPFSRALEVREHGAKDPFLVAVARRYLGESLVVSKQDPARGRRLLDQARSAYLSLDRADDAAEIDELLAARSR